MKIPRRYILLPAALLFLCSAAGADDLTSRLRDDETLVIPGAGAERILLSDTAERVLSLKGTPEKTARFGAAEELFEKVFRVRTDLKIPYDTIYYYRDGRCIVFMHQGQVSSVAGAAASRVTDLPADLGRGVERFILDYGNGGMATTERGGNKAYIFMRQGIALFDDGRDDRIDMYLVFRARPASP